MSSTTASISGEKCAWCNLFHNGNKCSLVKSSEYFPDGTLKSVVFFSTSEMAPNWLTHIFPVPAPQPPPYNIPTPIWNPNFPVPIWTNPFEAYCGVNEKNITIATANSNPENL
jgi:hypothetical protein